MRRLARLAGVAVAMTAFLAASAPTARGAVVALVNARIHTGAGPVIPKGTVVLRDGRVAAVGSAVAPPAGARILDVRGAWVTPGLFDAHSTVGLEEVLLEPATVDTHLEGYDPVRAAFSVVDGFNPRSVVIPVTRIEGITTIALVPVGGLVSGSGAVVDLAGARIEQMAAERPSAVYVRLAEKGRKAAWGARGGALLRLRELFDDVRAWARRHSDFEHNRMRRLGASRLDLAAMLPVVQGKLPLVVEVHRASDILAVLRLAKKEKVRVILTGAQEGWMVARDLAAAKVPVIVSGLKNLPQTFDRLGARLDNPALLHRAGVKIAISTRDEPHNSRTMKQEAGNAVAHGLPWEAALAAVTRNPAEIFGLGRRYGTLAPGKVANVVVWSGDPFETSTRVRHVFIRGREVPLRSRQTRLRERYRSLVRMRRVW